MTRIQTKYYSNILNGETSSVVYEYLRNNIEWEDGIRSRLGFTRKAKPMQIGMDYTLDSIIMQVINKMEMNSVGVHGIYLNYYRDGNDWTPNHSHPGMKQVVISLGATRTLTVGGKSYSMSNGDAIIFGSGIHGIPKDLSCADGRISIALFLEK